MAQQIIEKLTVEEPEIDPCSATQFRAKLNLLGEALATRGLKSEMAKPWFCRLAWSFGFQVVPPMYGKFWQQAAFLGSIYGVLYGLMNWFFVLGTATGLGGLDELLNTGMGIGVFYGIIMSLYFRRWRTRHGLPTWAELTHRVEADAIQSIDSAAKGITQAKQPRIRHKNAHVTIQQPLS